jgi:hypothetical protein
VLVLFNLYVNPALPVADTVILPVLLHGEEAAAAAAVITIVFPAQGSVAGGWEVLSLLHEIK